MANELVVLTRDLDGHKIGQRPIDLYVNGTELCRTRGKKIHDYLRLSATQEFLEAVASEAGIPAWELVQVSKGGRDEDKGTWVHPDVAVDVARWVCPKFAAQVARWVRELLTTGSVTIRPAARPELPWHHKLLLTRVAHVAHIRANYPGGFSIVSVLKDEIATVELVLHEHGLPTRTSDLPDGSVGKCWSNERPRLGLGGPLGYAPLVLPDSGATVQARVYAASERAAFDNWFATSYAPEKMYAYLKNKPSLREVAEPLVLASAADRACRVVANRPAELPDPIRRQLQAAGGMVRVRAG